PTRTPGPDGARHTEITPGAGKNPRPASSPFTRNSIECPRTTGSPYPNASPAAIRNCSRTRSSPATSSLTGCSTCNRVFTSKNEITPSRPTRNSHVPAPTYPASRQIALLARYNSATSSILPATFNPRPPPPNAALIATGNPYSRANATTSPTPDTGPADPATNGAPARAAIPRADTLSPNASIASAGGPTHVNP